MVKAPMDKNAPRKPLSAFTLFMIQRRQTSAVIASKPFAERNRILGAEWGALSADQKQVYYDQSAKQREAYKIALAEYKTSDAYKNWLALASQKSPAKEMAGKSRKRGKNLPTSNENDSNGISSDCKIAIFTREFLEYNRLREVTLRQLKKQAIQLEEETALLSKHVENLMNAETRTKTQIQTNTDLLDTEEQLMKRLCKELVSAFGELALPCNSTDSTTKGTERITETSVESFLAHLESLKDSPCYADLKANVVQIVKSACAKKVLKLVYV